MSQQNPWDFSGYSDARTPGPTPYGQPVGTPQAGPGQGPDGPTGQPDWSMFPDTASGPFAGAAPAAPSPVTAFGETAAPPRELVTAAPPIHLLAVAMLLAIAGIVLALVLGGLPPVAIASWVVAGPVAIGVLAWFMTSDLRARSAAVYAAQTWVRPAYIAVSVLCLVGAMVAAWRIADWVGRL